MLAAYYDGSFYVMGAPSEKGMSAVAVTPGNGNQFAFDDNTPVLVAFGFGRFADGYPKRKNFTGMNYQAVEFRAGKFNVYRLVFLKHGIYAGSAFYQAAIIIGDDVR